MYLGMYVSLLKRGMDGADMGYATMSRWHGGEKRAGFRGRLGNRGVGGRR